LSEETPNGEILLYETDDGASRIECRFNGDTLWLSLNQIAELFGRDKSVISKHLKAIFEDHELERNSVVANYATTAADGKTYQVDYYNLEAIFAVGYRVRSARGIQFRAWATARLKEYAIKGFVMDDERLKDPGGWDYFDELLARIREIRASEKRFYQKVRDLFALSSDYQPLDKDTQLFFAEVQNKLLYAVTGKTAAELIVDRADPDAPNMALTTWKGSRVRKQDVIVAKNYLSHDEVDTLNRLVTIFLEQAELRAKQRQDLTLDYWRQNVDRMLEFNEQAVLQDAGSLSNEQMREIAEERYHDFDDKRRQQEALDADAEDLKAIEDLEKDLKRKGGKA